jgi:hypothetical protein
MKFLALFLLMGAICLGADPAPAGVDALSPDDVNKAVSAIKESFVRPDALSDTETARATLQGLLDRLAPEVSLEAGVTGSATAAPFHSEECGPQTAYLRLGELTPANVQKAREALQGWTGLAALILDLRGTPASSDFDAGAGLECLFCPKGTKMFSLVGGSAPASLAGNPPAATQADDVQDGDPLFAGVLVVLVDESTAGAPEAVAASLQQCAKALLVGEPTAGRPYKFLEVPLGQDTLRVAVAQVVIPGPGRAQLGDDGLKPDIEVALGAASKDDIMQSITDKGVQSVTQEYDRPHLNEAALVAGSNPELDEIQAEQDGKKPPQELIDPQLERALDIVTSIKIFQSKG